MIRFKCEGCGTLMEETKLKIHTKGESEFLFCSFCSDSFVSNTVMYSSVDTTNRQVLITIAKSHNLIMAELQKIKRLIK